MNEIQNKQGFNCGSRLRAFVFAYRGLKALFRSECHARFHALAALVAIALGFSLRISADEWCIVILAIACVVASEAFNTAVESLTDRVSTERHPLSGKAKDVAAGGVLIACLGAAAVGAIIFGPKMWHLF